MLPWSVDPRETRRFRVTLVVVALVALAIGVLVPLLDLPEPSREELESVPPQLAKVILEKRAVEKVAVPKPVEPPKVEPKPEEKKLEKPKPVEVPPKPKPAEIKKPVVVESTKPSNNEVEAAREVAKSSGLLALSDELADMRESMSASSFEQQKPLASSAQAKQSQAERLVSEVSTRTSGGVDGEKLATVTERAGNRERATTQLAAPVEEADVAPTARARDVIARRSVEEIRRVFDANKAAIFSIYSRALRSNPALQGQVLLELTIEPSGQVSACKVVSSELADESLERRIMARIKLFDFGKKNVEQQVVTWPLDFLPS